jgi:hypothetical protein
MNTTIELIRETFHPDPYPTLEKKVEGAILHFSRESVGKCKYILLVSNIDEETDIATLIRLQKKELKRHYNASAMKGVGVIEVFIGNHADWVNKVHDVKPDWHGLQSVILQGLLFIDPEAKKHELTQSHWGPIKFGNFQGQMDKVHYLLGKLEA